MRTNLSNQILEYSQIQNDTKQRYLALTEVLFSTIDLQVDKPILRKIIELDHFSSEHQQYQIYAKLWELDPINIANKSCTIITEKSNAGDRPEYISWLIPFVASTVVDCPAAFHQANTLEPCCNDSCEWEDVLPNQQELISSLYAGLDEVPLSTILRTYLASTNQYPSHFDIAHQRLQYTISHSGSDCIGIYTEKESCRGNESQMRIQSCESSELTTINLPELSFQIDDIEQTIHSAYSSGVAKPIAKLVQNENTYGCSLDGPEPFYGFLGVRTGTQKALNSREVLWYINETPYQISGDIIKTRQIDSSNIYNGDTVSCSITVTQTSAQSLKNILKERTLSKNIRTFSSEPVRHSQ